MTDWSVSLANGHRAPYVMTDQSVRDSGARPHLVQLGAAVRLDTNRPVKASHGESEISEARARYGQRAFLLRSDTGAGTRHPTTYLLLRLHLIAFQAGENRHQFSYSRLFKVCISFPLLVCQYSMKGT